MADRLLRGLDRPFGATQVLAWVVVASILALLVPRVFEQYQTFLIIEGLILAIFGLSFNLVFGYTDLPSFGHAAFYGLGAYGFAMTLQHIQEGGLFLAIGAGIAAATVFGVVVGTISVRGKGIYFALLTFAFAHLLYLVAFRWTEFTGGTDGIFFSVPEAPMGVNLMGTDTLYYVCVVVVIGVALVCYRIVTSPFGQVLRAIKQNEQRARAIGYPVTRVKILVFTISAALASLSGILFAISTIYVSPETLYLNRTVDVLLITIIGGTNSLVGPIVGAGFLTVLEELTSDLETVGMLLTGVIFVVALLFMPQGITGFIRNRLR
jgi:branched-chain amino acid transport system permease protein